jgi:kinesin family member 5
MTESSDASVRVLCRVRPQNSIETSRGGVSCVVVEDDGVSIRVNSQQEGDRTFTYDRVFTTAVAQKEVYTYAALPIVKDVMQGYNGTVFAYGQTSSGKTFTMEGPDIFDPQMQGIIPRMVGTIFETVALADSNLEFTVRISQMEIYLERIRDLLDPTRDRLKVHEDKIRGVYVDGLMEEYVTDARDFFALMQRGHDNRSVASTGMNEASSRSHSIVQVTVASRDVTSNAQRTGKLYLVDLAGSEKVGKTQAAGMRLDEAKMINKSLSALGMVINALTDGKASHIPYRDSKLTRVLQESLGGNSRTSLIITCSESSYNEQETLSTLRFGARAKAIKNKAVINVERSVRELEGLLKKAEAEIARLRGGAGEGGDTRSAASTPTPTPSDSKDQEQWLRLQEVLIDQLQEKDEELAEKEELLRILGEEVAAEKQKVRDVGDLCEKAEGEKDKLSFRLEELTMELEMATSEMEGLRSEVEQLRLKVGFTTDDVPPDNEEQQQQQQQQQDQPVQAPLLSTQWEADEYAARQSFNVFMQQEVDARIGGGQEGDAGQEEGGATTTPHIPALQHVQQLEETLRALGEVEERLVVPLVLPSHCQVPSSAAQDSDSGRTRSGAEAEAEGGVTEDASTATPPSAKGHPDNLNNPTENQNENENGDETNLLLTRKLDSMAAAYANRMAYEEMKREDGTRRREGMIQVKHGHALGNANLSQGNWEQELARIKEDAAQQLKQFDTLKVDLFRDLQNRCEKVIELEMLLDESRDQYNTLLKNSSNKSLKKKIIFLERNLEQLGVVHQQILNENMSLKHSVQLKSKQLQSRDERITHLESMQVEQADAYKRRLAGLEEELRLARQQQLHHSPHHSSVGGQGASMGGSSQGGHLVRPLRGGGGPVAPPTATPPVPQPKRTNLWDKFRLSSSSSSSSSSKKAGHDTVATPSPYSTSTQPAAYMQAIPTTPSSASVSASATKLTPLGDYTSATPTPVPKVPPTPDM